MHFGNYFMSAALTTSTALHESLSSLCYFNFSQTVNQFIVG